MTARAVDPHCRVVILAFDGVEALDFAGPFEVFTTASRMHRRCVETTPSGATFSGLFEVISVSAGGAHQVVAARAGLRLLSDYAFADSPQADVLIVPGGVVEAALQDQATRDWIATQARSAQITASICTGAFLLAASGVLTHQRVTTHWEDIADLRARFSALQVVEGVRWVDAGTIVTSAGISAGIDMSLHLVERLAGRALAERTALQMAFSWTH